jgi:hypothetical protein
MAAPILYEAIYYLKLQSEQVEPTGLGLWRVSGAIQTTDEVIAYANELRKIDHLPPLGSPRPKKAKPS